jgi:hypothetical protein
MCELYTLTSAKQIASEKSAFIDRWQLRVDETIKIEECRKNLFLLIDEWIYWHLLGVLRVLELVKFYGQKENCGKEK